ncbi:MAG: CarD family transcriptional regulator [Eubacteriales bacterium]
MFDIGEHIVYGNNGVCLITDIGPSPFVPSDPRTYYTLRPLHTADNATIFIPVDNCRLTMRALMTRQEVEALMSKISDIEVMQVPQEKMRKNLYRQAMEKVCPMEYIRIIKTVKDRRAEAVSNRKRLSDTDQTYEALAKNCLYSELGLVLGLPLDEVEDYILQYVEAV